MEITGSTQHFLSGVLPDFRAEIFEMIEAAWPRVPDPFGAWLEPRITGLLRNALIHEQESRFDDPPFFISEEAKKRDPKTGKEIERSDLEIHLRHFYLKGQKPYFVFEAKRLNIPYKNTINCNGSEYVGDGGMGCLVAGQYESTRGFSGMLGYLMTGDVSIAKKAIEEAMKDAAKRLGLKKKPQFQPSAFMPHSKHGGETYHEGPTGDFILFHLFLPACSSK